MDRAAVLSARLATQRLSGPPAGDPVQVVRELLCVQAQDAPLARAMIALRCAGTAAGVQAAVASGALVRTHVLRPTWHYVAAEDLRWLLALTSAKVEAGMASRHRQLGLDEPRVADATALFAAMLAGRRFATRPELGAGLAAAGVLDPGDPLFGQQVGHLLLVGELRAQLCSAPAPEDQHRYALVDEVVLPAGPLDRDAALTRLVGRFVAGHGPVALADLTRWAQVTLTETRAALGRLGEEVERVVVDGEELWHTPASARPGTRPRRAWLVSTFDEVFLSYRRVGWPRSVANPDAADKARFSQSGGGPVLLDGHDVGGWKRRWDGATARVELVLDPTLGTAERAAVDAAAGHLLAVINDSGPPRVAPDEGGET